MSLQLGQTVPAFTLDSTKGSIVFHDYAPGKWKVLFSHPKDFTPICTTEFAQFARRSAEFEQRNAQLIGLSVDSVDDHHGWAADIAKVAGTEVPFPILADPDLAVAKEYGMFHPEADALVTVRSVFLIDPNNKARVILTYPPSIGRNVDEILRSLDALQQSDKQGVSIPVDWQPGDHVVVSPKLSDEEVEKQYPGQVNKVTDYLRFVPPAA
ncbi:MAG TPA: peroxiredoxin [Oleiagrimonas sp.]|nr:peroxiredoxin [Oleiagrimonas sp.]